MKVPQNAIALCRCVQIERRWNRCRPTVSIRSPFATVIRCPNPRLFANQPVVASGQLFRRIGIGVGHKGSGPGGGQLPLDRFIGAVHKVRHAIFD